MITAIVILSVLLLLTLIRGIMLAGVHAKTKVDLKEAKDRYVFWQDKHDREEKYRKDFQAMNKVLSNKITGFFLDLQETRAEHAALEDWVVQNYRTFLLDNKPMTLWEAVYRSGKRSSLKVKRGNWETPEDCYWIDLEATTPDGKKRMIELQFEQGGSQFTGAIIFKDEDPYVEEFLKKQPKSKA